MDIEFSDNFNSVRGVDYEFCNTSEYEDGLKICSNLEDVIQTRCRDSIRVKCIGQRGVGKTRFISTLIGNKKQKESTIGTEITPILVPIKQSNTIHPILLHFIDSGSYSSSKFNFSYKSDISLYFLSILDRVSFETLPSLLSADDSAIKLLILTSLSSSLKTEIFSSEISSLGVETFKEGSVRLLTHIGAKALDLLQRLDAQQVEKLEHH